MKSIVQYFASHPLIIRLILIMIAVVGVMSVFQLKRETLPNIDMGRVLINGYYPGAGPVDVEKNLVIPIENRLKAISGIESVEALAKENQATVLVTLEEDIANPQAVKDAIFRDMNNIADLPDNVEDIIVTDINPKIFPVIGLGLSVKKDSPQGYRELYDFTDILHDQLEKLPGVSRVGKAGYREREIRIQVDPEKAKRKYVALQDLVNSIKAANVRSSGGTLQSVGRNRNIVTVEEFQNPADAGEVIVRSGYSRQMVRVKDVARIVNGFKDADTRTYVNGGEGVVLNVSKKESADITQVVRTVRAFIAEHQSGFPDYINLSFINDQSRSISSLIAVVINNGVIGFFLVFVVLLVFLDWRSAFWTAVGLPVIFLIALTVMRVSNLTLNLITLGALITVMGILVDDGIIISENIYNYRLRGYRPLQAVLSGLAEVAGPVIIAVLTTMLAFSPMLFIDGTMGKMVRHFPVVIIVALVASLFEATLLLPGHLIHGSVKAIKHDWFSPVADAYHRFLTKVLKYRYLVVACFLVLLLGSFFLFRDGLSRFVLNNDNSADRIAVNVEAPEGAGKKAMAGHLRALETYLLRAVPPEERTAYQSVVGHHDDSHFNTGGHYDHYGQVVLYLVPLAERDREADAIVRDLNRRLPGRVKERFTHFEIKTQSQGPDTGRPIDIKVTSNNDEAALQLTEKVKAYLATLDGVTDINDDRSSGARELRLLFDKVKLARLGLTVQDAASTVRIAYEGTIATYVQRNDDRLDFRVELSGNGRSQERRLAELLIPNNQGRLIRLEQVASFAEGRGPARIARYNGTRTVTVSGEIEEGTTTSGQVMRQVRRQFPAYLNRYGKVYLRFAGESRAAAESLSGLLKAFIIAVLGIYFLLTLQFKSPAQPFLIMALLPFGLIGVFLAFAVHGEPLSFMGIIGVIGLCGVMVNDAIVMVDFINRLVEPGNGAGHSLAYNIAAGARHRLRPIILTTLTTVLGLIPTIYGIGGDAGMIVPVVMALAYGMLFATAVTLVLLPCFYLIGIDLSHKARLR